MMPGTNTVWPIVLIILAIRTAGSQGNDLNYAKAFSVVQPQDNSCLSESSENGTERYGTCLTAAQCDDKSGIASGSCASGFGVCCLFIADDCGDIITQNCTYIRNPGYPSVLDPASAGCSYHINKHSDYICQFRLDFLQFHLHGQTVDGLASPCQIDYMATSMSSGYVIPTLCGIVYRQHMYLDIGRGPSDYASLDFNIAPTFAFDRLWEIKVTQIPCSSTLKAPDGCLQYFTDPAGRITTFNFGDESDILLKNTRYSSCIRQEAGFCCVQYSACSDTNSFTLDEGSESAFQDNFCTKDFIIIEGATASLSSTERYFTRFCGGAFSTAMHTFMYGHPVYDCTPPFSIGFITDGIPEPFIENKRGVCLNYKQIPCGH